MCGCRDRVPARRDTTQPIVRAARPPCKHRQPSPEHRTDLMTTVENDLGGLAVADSRLGPSSRVALRRHQIQGREPRVVDGEGGFDEVFGPGYWLEIIDPKAEEWRV